jgi:two-component system sensor histidine kinase AlgZ
MTAPPFASTTRAYWACQAIGWGLYVAVTILQLLDAGLGLALAVAAPVVAAVIGIALTHGVRAMIRRRRWLARSSGALLARVVASSLVCACIHVGLLGVLEVILLAKPESTALDLAFAVVRWTIVFFAWHALYVGFGLVQERQRAAFDRVELERALGEAKLRALENALNPHFVFNALNTIRALVNTDAARADAAVTQLARLLRYALAAGREELVTVAHELDIVDDYLAIERLRLDARLHIERDIDEAATRGRVPAMLVQTLVENAIKHGVARLPEGGTLRISARIADDLLAIQVDNPRAPTVAPGPGIGLANATERLRLLCGAGASLRLDLTDARATARLEIPQ